MKDEREKTRAPATAREARAGWAALLLVASGLAACHRAPAANGPLRVYVSNEDANTVSVVDPEAGKVVATIEVGKRPRGLRLSPDGKTLYVALSGSPKAGPGVDETKLPPGDRSADGIGVVDVASSKFVRTLPSGQDPESFDITPDGKTMYVSNEETAEASVIDIASGKVVTRVPTGGEPEGVTVRPDGKVVYVTSEGENKITVIDVARNAPIASIVTGARPRSVVFSADGARAYVTAEAGAVVNVVDARTHAPLSTLKIPPGKAMAARPMGARLSPDGRRLYVSNGRAGTVSVVDTGDGSTRQTVELAGGRPWGLDLSPDGRTLFVANGPANELVVVDARSGEVKAHVAVGKSPWGVAATR